MHIELVIPVPRTRYCKAATADKIQIIEHEQNDTTGMRKYTKGERELEEHRWYNDEQRDDNRFQV